jgi:hypothetical protein
LKVVEQIRITRDTEKNIKNVIHFFWPDTSNHEIENIRAMLLKWAKNEAKYLAQKEKKSRPTV